MSDEAMDAEKEFDLDMDVIEPPLASPQEVPREKGTMLKCVHDLYVRASKNLSITASAKVKELLVDHNENTFHDPEKTATNTIEHEIPMTLQVSARMTENHTRQDSENGKRRNDHQELRPLVFSYRSG